MSRPGGSSGRRSAPWCSGLTCHPVTVEIRGSNPLGVATSVSSIAAPKPTMSPCQAPDCPFLCSSAVADVVEAPAVTGRCVMDEVQGHSMLVPLVQTWLPSLTGASASVTVC